MIDSRSYSLNKIHFDFPSYFFDRFKNFKRIFIESDISQSIKFLTVSCFFFHFLFLLLNYNILRRTATLLNTLQVS